MLLVVLAVFEGFKTKYDWIKLDCPEGCIFMDYIFFELVATPGYGSVWSVLEILLVMFEQGFGNIIVSVWISYVLNFE